MLNNFFSSFSFSWISDQGKHRANNEDAQLCLNNDGVYFVADGMGGGQEGEVASHIVIHYLRQMLQDTGNESPGERKQCLNSALNKAHDKIHEYALARNYSFMGTTVAGIIFNPWNFPSAVLCHVGDSRIYRVRQNTLELLTIDHTLENALLFSHRKLNERFTGLLTHAIGMKGHLRIDYVSTDLQGKDIFLLCTDGLSRTLDDPSIQEIVTTANIEDVPHKLVQAVANADGKDNTTIIVVQIPEIIPDVISKSDVDVAESRYLEELQD